MSELLHSYSKKFCKDEVPDLKPGYIVKVHQKITEGSKTRIQVFQGTVLAVNSGHGVDDTFTVRKISEGIGVEKVYPIHSPNVVKIEVMRAQKVRRAKLNFLRDRSGKALRLKEIPLKLRGKKFEKDVAPVAEDSSEPVVAPAEEKAAE
ncbi:50S ribosomal protein L19 [bacterium]|jgi:large subunit ribosomal protein L19|nr:50S ribosomal protein L19 [bacterium]MBT6832191.1 50S ribosomal protein L19 [bacterium]MBT6996136.1 50S ribosomal protein L19 [bacterium]MBT7772216.1 50S ribosomal protein L19 [bacterium]